MALPIGSALRSASRYVVRNPLSVFKVVRHAASMRLAVPLDAMRWFVTNVPPKKNAPTDVTIAARPPAIHVGATVDLMNTMVRTSVTVEVDELRIDPDEVCLRLRMSDMDMKVLGDSNSPVAGLLKSGALDLSKPGNLVNFMPKKPDALVEAKDDVVVIDLMKVPKLANNLTLRRVLQRLTPVVNIAALRTDGDFLVVALRATPMGFSRALSAPGY
jgi:hypothetical protein